MMILDPIRWIKYLPNKVLENGKCVRLKPPASHGFFALQRQTIGLHQDKEQLGKVLKAPQEGL